MSNSSSPSVVGGCPRRATGFGHPAHVWPRGAPGRCSWPSRLPGCWSSSIIPVAVVLVVSFFEPTLSGFNRVFTLDNYRLLADSDVFIRTLSNTVINAVITERW